MVGGRRSGAARRNGTLSLPLSGRPSGTLVVGPADEAALRELGRLLATRATATTAVRTIGFADGTGGEVYNLGLSQGRALSVRAILRTLVPQRVTVSYLGESNPVADNATISGRSRNRRVDLRFARLHPAAPPDSSRLRLHTVTTKRATEPMKLQSQGMSAAVPGPPGAPDGRRDQETGQVKQGELTAKKAESTVLRQPLEGRLRRGRGGGYCMRPEIKLDCTLWH
jgi:hypothetical protein